MKLITSFKTKINIEINTTNVQNTQSTTDQEGEQRLTESPSHLKTYPPHNHHTIHHNIHPFTSNQFSTISHSTHISQQPTSHSKYTLSPITTYIRLQENARGLSSNSQDNIIGVYNISTLNSDELQIIIKVMQKRRRYTYDRDALQRGNSLDQTA